MYKILIILIFNCFSAFSQNSFNLDANLISLSKKLEMEHPSEFFKEVEKLSSIGKTNDAAFIYFLGKLRTDYFILTSPRFEKGEEENLVSSKKDLAEKIIMPLLKSDVQTSLAIINAVILWDSNHDYMWFSKTIYSPNHEKALNELKKIKDLVNK